MDVRIRLALLLCEKHNDVEGLERYDGKKDSESEKKWEKE